MTLRWYWKAMTASALLALVVAPASCAEAQSSAPPAVRIPVDGSGRARLSLRASDRRDMREVKGVTDFRLVRFHGIFDRGVGVYWPHALALVELVP